MLITQTTKANKTDIILFCKNFNNKKYHIYLPKINFYKKIQKKNTFRNGIITEPSLYSLNELVFLKKTAINDIKLNKKIMSIPDLDKYPWNLKRFSKFNNSNIIFFKYQRKINRPKLKKQNNKKHFEKNEHSIIGIKLKKIEMYNLGIIAEKKFNELYIYDYKSKRFFFNHLRYYGEISNLNYIKKIVFGDYNISFGQGLIALTVYKVKDNHDINCLINSSKYGLFPNSSIANDNHLRGLGLHYKYNDINFILFGSTKNLNSVIKYYGHRKYVNTIYFDNTIDSWKKVKNRSNLNETILGSTFFYENIDRQISFGIVNLFQNYDLSIKHPFKHLNYIKKDYKEYYFHGHNNLNTSFFINYLIKNTNFFSELAFSYLKQCPWDFGIISGFLMAIGQYLDFAILVRHYGSYFHTIRGNAFRNHSLFNKNEQGLCIGSKFYFNKKLIFNNSLDLIRIPSPEILYPFFSKKGYIITNSLKFKQSKKRKFIILHKFKKMQKWNSKFKIKYWTNQSIIKLKYNQSMNEYIKIKTELQSSFYYDILIKLKFGYGINQSMELKFLRYNIKIGNLIFLGGKKDQNSIYIHTSNEFNQTPILYQGIGIKPHCNITLKTTNFKITLSYECKYFIKQKKQIYRNKHHKICAYIEYKF